MMSLEDRNMMFPLSSTYHPLACYVVLLELCTHWYHFATCIDYVTKYRLFIFKDQSDQTSFV